jgi:hypothetical protein
MSSYAAQLDRTTAADAAARIYPDIVAARVQGKPIDPARLEHVLSAMSIDLATFEADAAALRWAQELERQIANWRSNQFYGGQRSERFDAAQRRLAEAALYDVKQGNRRVFKPL